jgi:uncharacterized membrane protein
MSRFAILLLLVFGASQSQENLEQLARSGAIQESAPVKASVEITINAPPEKVWSLLTDVQNWPKWQREITRAEISGPLASGTVFSWSIGGASVKSKIAWTGTAYMAKAIHVWKLQRLPHEHTLVKVDESMDGFLLRLFFSSEKLKAGDQRWLDDLKKAAEQ